MFFLRKIKERVNENMKRLVDIVISLVALIVLSPIFLLVAYKVRGIYPFFT